MELLLPAGSPEQAWEALENGADAVYFGLKDFSARKAAPNFSRDEARELKQLCIDKGKKLYCTLNTIITNPELPELARTLRFIEYLEADGIIMQDFAVLNLANKLQIDIPLHASTQMAVHNSDGAKFMLNAGIRRIILAREMTIEEIEKIRRELPDAEFEVFIHGAMCCSISGNCFASSAITGRSGNRGECAQICRTWFSSQKDKGYYFSAADLHRGPEITALKKTGINSLKIEGRMKSPRYAGLAAKYYRKIIEEGIADPALEKELVTSFSRTSWPGFSKAGLNGMTDSRYPGPKGIKAGKVLSCPGKTAVLKLEEDLSARDGVMFFVKTQENGLPEALKMSWPVINEKNRKIFDVKAGETVSINVKNPVEGNFFKISSAKKPYKGRTKPKKLNRYKKAAAITVTVFDDSINLHSIFNTDRTYKTEFSKSTGNTGFSEAFKSVLAKSGESYFCAGNIEFIFKNSTGKHIFAPPSLLKSIKNDFFGLLDSEFTNHAADSAVFPKICTPNGSVPIMKWFRSDLSPAGNSPLPFFTGFSDQANQKPTEKESYVIIPINPVLFKTEKYLSDLKKFLKETKESEKTPFIGLNNPAHFQWAEEQANNGYEFFIDYALCCANRESLDFLRQKIPEISAVVPWIEDNSSAFETDLRIIEGYDNFSVPLFTSRHCYFSRRPGCAACGRKPMKEILIQNKKEYLLYQENCINYLLFCKSVNDR